MISLGQWAVTVSMTVFVEDVSAELALKAGQKLIDAGDGSMAVSVEQME